MVYIVHISTASIFQERITALVSIGAAGQQGLSADKDIGHIEIMNPEIL